MHIFLHICTKAGMKLQKVTCFLRFYVWRFFRIGTETALAERRMFRCIVLLMNQLISSSLRILHAKMEPGSMQANTD